MWITNYWYQPKCFSASLAITHDVKPKPHIWETQVDKLKYLNKNHINFSCFHKTFKQSVHVCLGFFAGLYNSSGKQTVTEIRVNTETTEYLWSELMLSGPDVLENKSWPVWDWWCGSSPVSLWFPLFSITLVQENHSTAVCTHHSLWWSLQCKTA